GPARGVVGSGGELVDEDVPTLVVDVDQVGERAAHVHSEAFHGFLLDLGMAAILMPDIGRVKPCKSKQRLGRVDFGLCLTYNRSDPTVKIPDATGEQAWL